MLTPYKKQYIRFVPVEETGRTLVYAILLEHNGTKEVALSELQLVRIIVKNPTILALAAGIKASLLQTSVILSPFTQSFFAEYKIPHFSYARPPTQ